LGKRFHPLPHLPIFEKLKKRTTILLLIIYLIGATEAYQLLKLPALVVHFMQHSREDPEMTLELFFEMHYAGQQAMDADWQQDMQLPFKSHEDGSNLTPLSYFPPAPLEYHSEQNVPETIALFGMPGHFIPVRFMADIFQPPRFFSYLC
jgi:hypothetical protein